MRRKAHFCVLQSSRISKVTLHSFMYLDSYKSSIEMTINVLNLLGEGSCTVDLSLLNEISQNVKEADQQVSGD